MALAGSASGATLAPQIHTIAGGGDCTVTTASTTIPAGPSIVLPCDGVAATSVPVNRARSVAALPGGGFLYVDSGSDLVREVSPAGVVTTVAGNGTTTDAPDGSLAVNSGLNGPVAVAPLTGGGFLITEYAGSVVRMVSPAPTATITTIAGTGAPGTNGTSGKGTATALNYPTDAEPTSDGRVLIADTYNNDVKILSAAAPGATISTIAGGGACNDIAAACEGMTANAVALNHPDSVSPIGGGSGGYLVAEYDASMIRQVSATSPSGTFTTVAGSGSPGYGGDGGPATSASLNHPEQVLSTTDGGFLIADANNERIRQVSPAGTITTIAGNGVASYVGDGGAATSASLDAPAAVSPTPDGGFLIADGDNGAIRQVTIAPVSTIALSPATPNGLNGWYSSPVFATISSATGTATRCELDPGAPPPAYDALSPSPCAFADSGAGITGDGAHTLYAASVNAAGDKELPVSVSFKIDATPPSLQCQATPSFPVGARRAMLSATLTDLVSGPMSSIVTAPADTSRLGRRKGPVIGADNAGQKGVVLCPYTVLPVRLVPTPVFLWRFAPTRAYTTVTRLLVSRVPTRAGVNVTCRGRGCPFRRIRDVHAKPCRDRRCKSSTSNRLVATHAVDLTPLFAHRRLMPGTRLTLTVTKENAIGRAILFTIRTGKEPSHHTVCLAPAGSVPARGC